MPLPISALGKELQVELLDLYGDHTLWARIADGEGRRTLVCIDGRAASPTRFGLFQQATHPRKAGAVLVGLGAPEEGVVVGLLSHYLDSGGPKALGLTEFGWEMAREILLRLGEPSVPEASNQFKQAETDTTF